MMTIAAPEVAELKPRQIPVLVFLVATGLTTMAALLLRKPKILKTPAEIKDQ